MKNTTQNPWYQKYLKNPVVSMLGGTLHTIGLWKENSVITTWQAVTSLSKVPLMLERIFVNSNKNKDVLDWGVGRITTASMLLIRELLNYMQFDNSTTISFSTICPNITIPSIDPMDDNTTVATSYSFTSIPESITLPPLPPIGYQEFDTANPLSVLNPEQLYVDMVQLLGTSVVTLSYIIVFFTGILKNYNVISANYESKVKRILKYVTLAGWITKSSGLIMENNYISAGLHLSGSILNFINDFENQSSSLIGSVKLEISCVKSYSDLTDASINSQTLNSLTMYNFNYNLDNNGKFYLKHLKEIVDFLNNKKEEIKKINFETKIGDTKIQTFPAIGYDDVININYQDNGVVKAIVAYLNSLTPESETLQLNDEGQIELKSNSDSWFQCVDGIFDCSQSSESTSLLNSPSSSTIGYGSIS